MEKSGKSLEQMVRQIEGVFLPQGFTVAVNERIFDDNGNQLAEFDICVSGNVGTAPYRWLIECRDRPSDGPAPGSWIEQLVARKDRFGFDKVTAVSTTGFADGAIDYAKQKNIDIRSLDRIASDEITDWLKLSEATILVKVGIIHHVILVIDEKVDNDATKALKSFLATNGVEQKMTLSIGTKSPRKLPEIWQDIINSHTQMFDNILPNLKQLEAEIRVNFKSAGIPCSIQTPKGPVSIAQVVFRAMLSLKRETIPFTRITQYSRILDLNTIAQTAHLEISVADKVIDIALHNFGENDKTLVVADVR